MQGARRRPYVDMVKEGNEAADRPGRNPEGRGNLGAFLCREPSQYRHIASGSPPRTASHIASVAHVPIYEIGSELWRRTCTRQSKHRFSRRCWPAVAPRAAGCRGRRLPAAVADRTRRPAPRAMPAKAASACSCVSSPMGNPPGSSTPTGKCAWTGSLRLPARSSAGPGTTLSTREGETTLSEGNVVELAKCKPENK